MNVFFTSMLTIYDDITIAKSDEFRRDDIVMHYICKG